MLSFYRLCGKERVLAIILAVMTFIPAGAYSFNYKFDETPVSEAIVRIGKEHPDIDISFIYKELDRYKTSARVHTDDAYTALRRTVGLNPVSVVQKNNHFYIEALQRGRYVFSGTVVGQDEEPLAGVSVLFLAPRDSAVITYGITDAAGRFSVPCDKEKVIAKFVCMGYRTGYVYKPLFDMGIVELHPAPIHLSDVSVAADNTVLAADKNSYIPSSRQKNASQDAADLLRRMAIPQLVVNPGDNVVKDVFGNKVAIYINSHEAQEDELKGMKMTDVRKIEYLEFPADPRFRGEQRVVNFIVQEYEYGGYTKISEAFRTLSGVFNSTDVFSRLTYKKMTYDIYAGSDNRSFHHDGSDISAVYRLGNNGDAITVRRNETLRESQTKSDRYPLTFRATYTSPSFTARNMLSFTHFSSPEQYTAGDLSIDLHSGRDYSYRRSSPDRSNTVSYNGNYWGLIGANASFDITPAFRYTHRNCITSYESTLIQNAFRNDITEDAYNWSVQATGSMAFGKKNRLSLTLAGGQNINRLLYAGANNADDSYSNSFMVGFMRYRYQTQKISLSATAGFGYEHNVMNMIRTSDVYPRFNINAWFSLNKNSQISAYVSYLTTAPDISMKANDIVQSNEYMYLTANPELKNWRNFNSNVAYNLYLNNSFSMAAFAGYDRNFGRVATVYRPYLNGTALLRDFINDGSFIRCYYGISLNYKLLRNSLQLYANLSQNAYNITGAYKDSYSPFRFQLQAVYYWKAFNILAAWTSPESSLTENSNYIIRGRNFHMLSVGWGNGIWAVNIAARNIFNRGWHSATWEKQTQLYDEYQLKYNPSAHASVEMTVTYTIGYGKKIQRGNEVAGQDRTPSAIIR